MGQMDEPAGGAKRPYEKPEIKQVALRPEEAVLGACKATSGGGGSGPGGGNCRTPAPCSSLGS
jgi:hypothetical protein